MDNSLKPLIRSLLLVLGLFPVATLSAETDPLGRKETTQSNASVFNGTIVENTHYAPQLNLGGFYGTHGASYGEMDFWLPVWQTATQIAYTDVRFQKDEANQWDFALGAGYRWLSQDLGFLYDLHGFYNSYNSDYNNQFQQVMVGGFVRNADWTVSGNYYYSIGTTEFAENSLTTLGYNPIGGIQNTGLISYGFEQNFLNGGVIEVGRTIPYSPGLSLFGGYYGFASTDTRPFVNGFRARAEYVLDEAFNFKTPFLRRITLESVYQYDNVNKNIFTVGARVDIPLGKSSTSSKLQEAMMDYIHFDPYLIQADTRVTKPTTFTQNGKAVIFDRVTSEAELNTALSDDSNVVVVENDIDLTNTANASNSKYVTGQSFEYAPGRFINITGNSDLPTLTIVPLKNMFIIGSNDTLRDMNLTMPDTFNGTHPFYAITNQNGLTVGTLNLSNIVSNAPLSFTVSDNSTNSNISVTDSSINMGVSQGLNTPVNKNSNNNGISVITTGNTSVTVNTISGNTITFGDNVSNGIGIFVQSNDNSVQHIGIVDNNQITFGANAVGQGTGFGGMGIQFFTDNNSTQTINSASNNVISTGTGATGIFGIQFYSNSKIANLTSTQTIQNVNANTINFGDNASGVVGLYFWSNSPIEGTVQNIASVSGNRVNFGDNATGNATNLTSGIYFQNNSNGKNAQLITNVNSNVVTFKDSAGAGANSAVYGLNFSNLSTSSSVLNQYVTNVNSNTVAFGTNAGSNNGQAYGIYFGNGGNINLSSGNNNRFIGSQTINNVNANTVSFGTGAGSNSGQAYGLYFFSGANIVSTFASNLITVNSQAINNVIGNAISFGDQAGGTSGLVRGLYFKSVGTTISSGNTVRSLGQPIGHIDNNTVSFNGAVYNGVGIYIYPNAGSSNPSPIIQSIDGNTVTFNGDATSSIGIYIYNPANSSVSTIGALTNNNIVINGAFSTGSGSFPSGTIYLDFQNSGTINAMYGNKVTGKGNTLASGVLNVASGKTLNIYINSPTGSYANTLAGLSQANNNMTLVPNQGGGTLNITNGAPPSEE